MQEHTDTPTPSMAPGCYASPSVFASDSDICRGCPVFNDCAQACVGTLEAMRDRINIDSLLARHREARRTTIEAAPQEEPTLPVAVKFMPSIKPSTEKVERKAPPPRRVVAEVTADQQAIVDSISQSNAKKLALKWCKDGIVEKIKTDMSQGRNPFDAQDSLAYCAVACEALLAGTLTRRGLKELFMKRMGKTTRWDERTAASHVGIVMPALVAFGIAVETPAGFVVNPEIGRDNV
jgi:hypothetical protein